MSWLLCTLISFWSSTGIVNFGIKCGWTDVPGVYMDVAYVMCFITWAARYIFHLGLIKPDTKSQHFFTPRCVKGGSFDAFSELDYGCGSDWGQDQSNKFQVRAEYHNLIYCDFIWIISLSEKNTSLGISTKWAATGESTLEEAWERCKRSKIIFYPVSDANANIFHSDEQVPGGAQEVGGAGSGLRPLRWSSRPGLELVQWWLEGTTTNTRHWKINVLNFL